MPRPDITPGNIAPPTHHTPTTADGFLNHLTTLHHFRFRSSGNPAFFYPPHFLLLSLMHSLSLSPKILHTSHTLFCHEVHSPSSRSRCCLAIKRTINLRAILLLNVSLSFCLFCLSVHLIFLSLLFSISLVIVTSSNYFQNATPEKQF